MRKGEKRRETWGGWLRGRRNEKKELTFLSFHRFFEKLNFIFYFKKKRTEMTKKIIVVGVELYIYIYNCEFWMDISTENDF